MTREILKTAIRTFPPAYFALPMATGIITIASFTLGYEQVSDILYVINNLEMGVLGVVLILRLLFYFTDFRNDLSSHTEGAGFLTIVAALCLFGSIQVLLRDNPNMAMLGWCLAFVVWILLSYSFFILISYKEKKPSLQHGINGSWLLMVVAVQALSISGDIIVPYFGILPQMRLFITLSLFLLGVLFYLIIIVLIFYRTAFLPMPPGEFRHSYWINMGAAAISAFAGATLVKDMAGVPEFEDFIPILKIFTLLFWVGGTWWIPIIGIWEFWKRTPVQVRYSAGYWSLVFPLGVYTVCTWHMADAIELPSLKHISEIFIFIAWAAWLITYIRMGVQLVKIFSGQKRIPPIS
ncbi:MAG TPA: tellurite resistance/C4-dicarboxylate transporter family protein [Ginsengibacter sp.]|nr:tellurite resistance/C4-dicarboxylate transporter family protein [Ginsengibacter sp.]HRP17109.1 tellurite resistance/C4-dicarboxylate transporter family protein [Ginsengibacter sp.]HRP44917.1 tellurite resistance/C4-dicarboxylate transporter family protein [Ginsengibacter sp.]